MQLLPHLESNVLPQHCHLQWKMKSVNCAQKKIIDLNLFSVQIETEKLLPN